MRSRRPVLLLLLAGIISGPVQADGREWLDKMSRAIQELNYEGTFVYLHGNQMETVRIIHRKDASGERERLVSLNGSAREVIRDNEQVTCILPDSQSVMVHQSRPRKPFPAAFTQDLDRLSRYYAFRVVGSDRMAGANARIIAVEPVDEYRYGYRMWLDEDTHLLLKSELIDVEGMPVEQVMFTDFRVRDRIEPEELAPALSGSGFTRFEVPVNQPRQGLRGTAERHAWQVDRLPRGFMMTDHEWQMMPPDPEKVEHLVYSDGLATVSVFVEKPHPEKEALDGSSAMGAVNAYGRQVDGYQVTVVGEVPKVTVKMIALSARPAE